MVESLTKSSYGQRYQWIKDAKYNLINLKSSQIFLDLLTDSGTGAMSDKQWAEMMTGDESYAGSRSYFQLKDVAKQIFGIPYFIPVHQGRAAEHVLFSTLLKAGDIVPGNMHFVTTKEHITLNNATAIDCTINSACDITNQNIFKGNIDLEKLESLFKSNDNIPLVILTITCNSIGGLPVSMQNIQETSSLCKKYHCPLYFDAARFAENAYFIKKYEKGFEKKTICEIVKEMFSHVEGFMLSGKKNGIVNMGGLIGLRSETIFKNASVNTVRYEGYITYGGLSGRDLSALAQGLLESTEYDYLESRVEQVAYLGNRLKQYHIPLLEPFGGHAIFINAGEFYHHIPQTEYRGQFLNSNIYLEGGIRGVGIDGLSNNRDPDTGKEVYPPMELVRLALPTRVYTNSHMDYIAATVANVFEKRHESKRGLKLVKDTKLLRSFMAELEPTDQNT